MALTTERFREKGMSRNQIAKQSISRGAEVFGYGILFRILEYALGHKWVPWTDLFRVDILNTLGLSIMFMGVLCWLASPPPGKARTKTISAALAVSALIALLTPPLWSIWRPRFLPWPLESYINGVHTFGAPQRWLFPIFPWCAFAFVGLAVGLALLTPRAHKDEMRSFAVLAGVGVAAIALAVALDALPIKIYALQDFWGASPNFLMARCGVMLLLLAIAYGWCQLGWGQGGFSPVIQLGKTSLLVYWVHIEFVYGRFAILRKHENSIAQATIGLIVIFLAMLALSLWRTEAKEKSRTTVLPLQSQQAVPTT